MLALRSHWLRRRVRALHGVAERRRAWGGTEARHRAEARAQRTYHALARGFWPRALQSFIGFMPRGVGVKAIGLGKNLFGSKPSKLVRFRVHYNLRIEWVAARPYSYSIFWQRL